MLVNPCGCEFWRTTKRRCVGVTTSRTTTDRLSHLPEPILCHILSFLDTKSVVQTSVLSRVWRGVWIDVPALHLHRGSFQEDSSFEKFVLKVLSLRHHIKLRMLCYTDNTRGWTRKHKSMFVKVIKYVVSYEAEHLIVDMGNDKYLIGSFKFSYLFGSILRNCNLKTLELRYITLDSGFGWSGLQMLTTLNVDMCLLDTDKEDLDLFSNLPSLMNLAMYDCYHRDAYHAAGGIKIHGQELLSLTLDLVGSFKIEIFAPKLKVFSLCENSDENLGSKGYLKLSLPSVDRADIAMTRYPGDVRNLKGQVQVEQYFHFLFQGLHNAKTLQLSASVIQVLKEIREFLHQQPPPFKRLETLIVASENLPYKLINYFLKGSSCEDPKVIIDLDNLLMRPRWLDG